MTKQEVLGMCMRNARKEMRISAEQVAEKLGKTKQGIGYWENGKRNLTAVDLFNYLDAINYDQEKFFRTYYFEVENRNAK